MKNERRQVADAMTLEYKMGFKVPHPNRAGNLPEGILDPRAQPLTPEKRNAGSHLEISAG